MQKEQNGLESEKQICSEIPTLLLSRADETLAATLLSVSCKLVA